MKLFCKHNYKYYGTEEKYTIFSPSNYPDLNYMFVCDKCNAEYYIPQWDLREELKKAKLDMNKKIMLNKYIETKQSELSIKPYLGIAELYSGEYVTDVILKYQQKGVNLLDFLNVPKQGHWIVIK